MRAVAIMKPYTPLVICDVKIEINELTATFPSKSVHSNKLPFCLIGMIFFAHHANCKSSPWATISKPVRSRPNKPNVRPEKRPESATSTTITTTCKNGFIDNRRPVSEEGYESTIPLGHDNILIGAPSSWCTSAFAKACKPSQNRPCSASIFLDDLTFLL